MTLTQPRGKGCPSPKVGYSRRQQKSPHFIIPVPATHVLTAFPLPPSRLSVPPSLFPFLPAPLSLRFGANNQIVIVAPADGSSERRVARGITGTGEMRVPEKL